MNEAKKAAESAYGTVSIWLYSNEWAPKRWKSPHALASIRTATGKTISDKCGQSKWSKIAQDVKVREVHVKEMQCCERVVFQCEPEKVVWNTTAGDGFLL